jgi:hypothetical protein
VGAAIAAVVGADVGLGTQLLELLASSSDQVEEHGGQVVLVNSLKLDLGPKTKWINYATHSTGRAQEGARVQGERRAGRLGVWYKVGHREN